MTDPRPNVQEATCVFADESFDSGKKGAAYLLTWHRMCCDSRNCLGLSQPKDETRAVSLTISVINDRVHDGDIRTPVGIPPIGILGSGLALAEAADVDVVEDDIGGVGDKVIVLRAVAQHQVGDDAVVEAVDAEEHGPEGVDVLGVEVVPDLSVAVDGAT